MGHIQSVLTEFWTTLAQMGPYLLFGFLVAGILSVLVSPEVVERHLGGRGWKQILKAASVGVPLPLCSCSVIPVATSLRRHGASRGSTMAFLLSAPQIGVDSIAVTYSLLGPIMAAFRPLAALVTGIVGGRLADLGDGSADQPPPPEGETCTDDGCSTGPKRNALVRALRYAFITLPRDIARPMILGLVLAGLIGALVPEDFFAGRLGTGLLPILAMMVIGIPLYVCATASVPIAAALIVKGVSAGAALAFLIAGPATNAAAITTIWKVLGRRATFIYLGTVAVAAIVSGLVLDALFAVQGVKAADIVCHTDVSFLQHLSGAVMLTMLGIGLWNPSRRRQGSAGPLPLSGEQRVLKIKGMTCAHCAESVERALVRSPGVESVQVDLETGRATIAGSGLDSQRLVAAVQDLGYKAAVEATPAPVPDVDPAGGHGGPAGDKVSGA